MEVSEQRPVTCCQRIDVWSLVTAILVLVVMTIIQFATSVDALYVPPNDSLSSFPYHDTDTVSAAVLIVIVLLVPLVLICAAYFASRYLSKWLREFNPFTAVWVFLTIFGLTNAATDLLKNYVGRARPNVIARCGQNATLESCRAQIGDAAVDEFQSWPSGHSSLSMATSLFEALFIQELVRARSLAASAFAGFILFVPLYIGASRIRDFRHHTDDVLAGFFVGTLCTIIVWIQVHKRIFPKNKDAEWTTGGAKIHESLV
jgi:phosphatidate phosphatase